MTANAIKRALRPACYYVNVTPIMIALACDEDKAGQVRDMVGCNPYKAWTDHGVYFAEFLRPARLAVTA